MQYINPNYAPVTPASPTLAAVFSALTTVQKATLANRLQAMIAAWPAGASAITTHDLADRLLTNWPAAPFPTIQQCEPRGGIGRLVDALLLAANEATISAFAAGT